MKKNRIIIALLIVMLCLTFAGCGGKTTVTPTADPQTDGESSATIPDGETPEDTSADRDKFILGLDASFPPMGYTDEGGNIVGFDIDVARAVCDKLGWELILQPIDWDANILELNSGNIDCIWNGMTVTAERDEAMSLSVPYMNNEQVIVVMADSEFNTLEDLAGHSLVLQSGSSAVSALEGATDFKASLSTVNALDDNMKVMMEIEQGSSDAALLDSILAEYYITINGAEKYRILDEALATEEYAIGFRKEDVALTNLCLLYIQELHADGTLVEISNDWFGTDVFTLS